MQQLTLDYFDAETSFIDQVCNQFFVLGFTQQMNSSTVVSRNMRQALASSLEKNKFAQFFLPLRSQSYVGDNAWIEVQKYLETAFKFTDKKKSNAVLWDKEPMFASYKTGHTLDSVSVDARQKNTLAITLFISRHQSFTRSKLDLRESQVPTKIALHLVFNIVKDKFLFNDKLSFCKKYTYIDKVGAFTEFKVSEVSENISLAWIYSFFNLERLRPFFPVAKNQKLPDRISIGYIGVINIVLEYFITKNYFDKIKLAKVANHKKPKFFSFSYSMLMSEVVFTTWIESSPLLKDILPDPYSLYPSFTLNVYDKRLNVLNALTDTFKTLNFTDFVNTDSLNNDPYYPKSSWAINKTALWWKSAAQWVTMGSDHSSLSAGIFEYQKLLRQVCLFYEMYHKYFSNDLAKADEVYPLAWITQVFYTSQIDHRDSRISNSNILLKYWLNASLKINQWLSIQKMRRLFSTYWMSPGNMELTNINLSAHLIGNYSLHCKHFSDIHVLLQTIERTPALKQNVATYIPWRNLTTPKQIHDHLSKFITLGATLNIKLQNSLYDNLLKADLKIPYTRLEIKIARDTHTVITWGSEQKHCIGGYASRINEPKYLLFGVWNNETNSWWGHSCMTRQNDNQDGSAWREYQFLGHSNKGLDSETKKLCIEFVMEKLYPKKEEKKEEQTEQLKIPITAPKIKEPKKLFEGEMIFENIVG